MACCATVLIETSGVLCYSATVLFLLRRRLQFVDGVGKSTEALFAILNRVCLFLVDLFIILCVVVVP